MSRVLRHVRTGFALLLLALPLVAERPERWALVLEDPPLAAQIHSRKELATAAIAERRQALAAAHAALRETLAERRIQVTGSIQTLLNAVFVAATEDQVGELRGLPGVAYVAPMRRMKRHLNKALDLVNARAAWNTFGGMANAGAGMKIGVLDTGIDQNHPAFRDPALSVPPGFPKGAPEERAYTNNKVIVARSYVLPLALFDGKPENTRPDDLSPRDRVGHGTAVAMVAAGITNSGPAAPITGVAPKAWIGNYKIFGSPGVNDVTFSDVVFEALDDAFNDGMDVVTLSLGFPATWSLHDQGAACGNSGSQACDPWAAAVENAARNGMAIVVSAGNDGEFGLNTIHTPGAAPSAITAGATTNAHQFFSTVRLPTGEEIDTLLSDGPKPLASFQAPLRDVSKLNDDGKACSPLTNGSLSGAIALILRGDCGFAVKVSNAQKAGAVAAVIYREPGRNLLFTITGLAGTGIPSMLIGADAGAALKSYLTTRPDALITIDPALTEVPSQDADETAFFSSQGPGITDSVIKPEVAAVGTSVYTATQTYDPNGDLFSTDGYTAVDGTSFATPMAAGAVALVKQRNPGFTAAQLKSAVTNTASTGIIDFDSNGNPFPARVTAVGAGKLNVADAVRVTLTADPATVSFGVVTTSLPSRGVRITNSSNAAVNVRLAVNPRDPDSRARVTVNPSSFSLGAGQSAQVTVRLEGSLPSPGFYEGAITVEGGPAPLRIPYLYLAGDGVPFNLIPLEGQDWVEDVGFRIRLTFKVVDRFGVPIPNVPVAFLPAGALVEATRVTDGLGIAEAVVVVGPQLGEQSFAADAGGFRIFFDGRTRLTPTIRANGVVNAASQLVGNGLAPCSYASIYGVGLSEAYRVYSTPYLPLSLAGVSVGFDAPSRSLSLPGRLHFVTDNQINVQIPCELQGLNSVLMKVAIGNSQSDLYTVPLADYSPAFFEYQEQASGRLLAAALDEKNQLVSTANPLQRGHVIQFFVNGLGPVDNQPPTGEPTPAQPFSQTRVLPIVTIGGQRADVRFSGLAPLIVGLYQVNVLVPTNIDPGFQQAVLTIGGVFSKATAIPVQ